MLTFPSYSEPVIVLGPSYYTLIQSFPTPRTVLTATSIKSIQRHASAHDLEFMLTTSQRWPRRLARLSPALPLSHLGPYALLTQAFAKVAHDDTGPYERNGEDQHRETGKGGEGLWGSEKAIRGETVKRRGREARLTLYT